MGSNSRNNQERIMRAEEPAEPARARIFADGGSFDDIMTAIDSHAAAIRAEAKEAKSTQEKTIQEEISKLANDIATAKADPIEIFGLRVLLLQKQRELAKLMGNNEVVGLVDDEVTNAMGPALADEEHAHHAAGKIDWVRVRRMACEAASVVVLALFAVDLIGTAEGYKWASGQLDPVGAHLSDDFKGVKYGELYGALAILAVIGAVVWIYRRECRSMEEDSLLIAKGVKLGEEIEAQTKNGDTVIQAKDSATPASALSTPDKDSEEESSRSQLEPTPESEEEDDRSKFEVPSDLDDDFGDVFGCGGPSRPGSSSE